MLVHRLRRRPNIEPTMTEGLVFAGNIILSSLEAKVLYVPLI